MFCPIIHCDVISRHIWTAAAILYGRNAWRASVRQRRARPQRNRRRAPPDGWRPLACGGGCGGRSTACSPDRGTGAVRRIDCSASCCLPVSTTVLIGLHAPIIPYRESRRGWRKLVLLVARGADGGGRYAELYGIQAAAYRTTARPALDPRTREDHHQGRCRLGL